MLIVPYFHKDVNLIESSISYNSVGNSSYAGVFYVHSDHIGSASWVTTGDWYYGTQLVQHMQYLPWGELWIDQRAIDYSERYTFSGKERDEETGLLYFGFRYLTPGAGIWTGVDPLSDKYPGISGYAYCGNNPVMLRDPDGRRPIYDLEGYLIGVDENGLQGDAIFMSKDDFKSHKGGWSAEDAANANKGEDKLQGNAAKKRYFDSFSNLKNRPDWDGELTLKEANDWYRNGNGEPLYVSLAKINLDGVLSLGESYVGQEKIINLLYSSNSLDNALVFGNIKLKRYPNHSVKAYADFYDFDMKSWLNFKNCIRNPQTILGGIIAGEGVGYNIHIYGSKKLKPILPWIK